MTNTDVFELQKITRWKSLNFKKLIQKELDILDQALVLL